MTYANAAALILPPVELIDVRRRIREEFERQHLTQEIMEKRSGIKQGVISRILDLNNPMREIRARIIFNLVEKGLQLPLSSFFLQLEQRHASGTHGASSLTLIPRGASVDRTVSPESTPDEELLADAGGRIVRTVITQFERVLAAQREESMAKAKPHGTHSQKRPKRSLNK